MTAINLLQQLFGGAPPQAGQMYPASRIFQRKYHAYSPAYWNSENRDKLELGDKIVLPASALEELSRMHVQFPIMFEIGNDSSLLPRKSHCSVLEFTAPEGSVYLPLWMIDNLGLDATGDSVIQLTTISLVKGTFVQFQAHETKFAMLSNPRVVLEKALRSYSCLTVGDTIQVDFANHVYKLDVTEVKPNIVRGTGTGTAPAAISIIETDIKVDFKEPRDYKQWQRTNQAQNIAKQNKKLIQDALEEKESLAEQSQFVLDPQQMAQTSKKRYFQQLEATGSIASKVKRQKKSKTNHNHNQNNSNSNSNNSNSNINKSHSKHHNQSTNNLYSYSKASRGAPLGRKLTKSKSVQLLDTNSKLKTEEIVGKMRYIYEVDSNGKRRLVRRLPVRDWQQTNSQSLKR